jgi:hypothetical protein
VYPDLRSLLQLERVLDVFLEHGGIDRSAADEAEKMAILSDAVEKSSHLDFVVPDKRDRSPTVLHFTGIDRSVAEVRQLMAAEGITVGNGYGPYSGVAGRLMPTWHHSKELVERAAKLLGMTAENASYVDPERTPNIARSFRRQAMDAVGG